jgi:hypothetical protein
MRAAMLAVALGAATLLAAGCASSESGGSGKMEMQCSKCKMEMKSDMVMHCPPPCNNDVKMGDMIMKCKCGAEVKCSDCTGKCPKCMGPMSQANCMAKCPKCGGSMEAKGMCCPHCMSAKK